MGTAKERSTRAWNTEEWRQYFLHSVGIARHLGMPEADAKDIAQTVMLRLYEKERSISHHHGWLWRATYNEVMDQKRREKRWRSDEVGEEDSTTAPADPVGVVWRGIITELEHYLRCHDSSGDTFRQLFGISIGLDQQLAREHLDGRGPATASRTLESLGKGIRDRKLQALGAHLTRQGIDWRDLLDALRAPDFLFSSTTLARLAADQASLKAEQLCHFTRRAHIDLLLRAQPERHNFDVRMQRAVWNLNELMFQVSQLHPKYMLLGGLRYLQCRPHAGRHDATPLTDARVQRRVLEPFLSATSRKSFADRWLATALYGALSEYAENSTEHFDDELSALMRTSQERSLQTIGIGWSWHNISRLRRAEALREKLFLAVPPGAWPGGLAALPTVIVSPYLSAGAVGLREVCHLPALWEVVMQALASRSHVAVLGGVVLLKNIQPSLCSPCVREEVARALGKLTDTQNPFLKEKLQQVESWREPVSDLC